MSVISTFEAIPSRLRMLYAFLLDRPQGEDRSYLIEITGPRTLPSASRALEDQGVGAFDDDQSSKTITNSLSEAIRMGLLKEVDGRISVAVHIDANRQREVGFDAAFTELLESILLDQAAPGFDSQRSFGYGLSWLLMQSPGRPLEFSPNHRSKLQEQLGTADDYQLTNYSAFQNLFYWARALGYCEFLGLSIGSQRKQFVVPDPTRSLGRNLALVLRANVQIAIADALQLLANRCPVLERGALREEVERRRIDRQRAERMLSESTSLALRRLERQGLLTVDDLADAEAWVLDMGTSAERITHITMKTGL